MLHLGSYNIVKPLETGFFLSVKKKKSCENIIQHFYLPKGLMELLDKVQLNYDASDEDVRDITEGEQGII